MFSQLPRRLVSLPGNPRPRQSATLEPDDALPRRVCVINFTGERANWGCQATSWELVRVLNRRWPAQRTFQLDTIPLLPHLRDCAWFGVGIRID